MINRRRLAMTTAAPKPILSRCRLFCRAQSSPSRVGHARSSTAVAILIADERPRPGVDQHQRRGSQGERRLRLEISRTFNEEHHDAIKSLTMLNVWLTRAAPRAGPRIDQFNTPNNRTNHECPT